jgi:hypothetical protein
MMPRTVLSTESAGGTGIGIDIARPQINRGGEISWGSIQCQQIGIGEHFNIGRPTGLYQFWCQDSERTVIGRKGLVKLGHNPANRRRLFHQVDVKTKLSQIKRGLNPGNTAAKDHYRPFPLMYCFTHNNITPEKDR